MNQISQLALLFSLTPPQLLLRICVFVLRFRPARAISISDRNSLLLPGSGSPPLPCFPPSAALPSTTECRCSFHEERRWIGGMGRRLRSGLGVGSDLDLGVVLDLVWERRLRSEASEVALSQLVTVEKEEEGRRRRKGEEVG